MKGVFYVAEKDILRDGKEMPLRELQRQVCYLWQTHQVQANDDRPHSAALTGRDRRF